MQNLLDKEVYFMTIDSQVYSAKCIAVDKKFITVVNPVHMTQHWQVGTKLIPGKYSDSIKVNFITKNIIWICDKTMT